MKPLLLAGAMLLAACARDAGGTLPADTIRIGSTLTPEEEHIEGPVRNLLFQPLLRLGDAGLPIGVLARHYEHSADGREWQFHLRGDVRWHDGVPFRAADVKFTLELLQHPEVAWAEGLDVQVLDDTTVIVRAQRPLPPGAWGAWPLDAMLPAHLLADQDPAQMFSWTFWSHAVGTGAYRMVRLVPTLYTELAADRDWYGAAPRIGRVIVRSVGSLRLANLMAGEVDLVAMVQPGEAAKLARDERFRSYVSLSDAYRVAIYWNTDRVPLDDVRIREAFTLALDRTELARLVGLDGSFPNADGFHTPQQARRGELPYALPHDPVRARRLLEQAGWRDLDGDGTRERAGRRLRVTLLGSDTWFGVGPAAIYVQEQLRRVGVEVTLTMTETAVLRQRMKERDFDGAFELFGMDGRHLRSERYGYRLGRRFDSLQQEAAATVDAARQEQLLQEMTMIFRAQLPATLLYPSASMHLAHRRLRGLSSPWRTNYAQLLPELWIEE